MNKNKFLLMLMATILVFTGSNTFAAEKVIKWKLAMTWPDGLPPFAWTVDRFAKNVEEMSGGRMTIRIDDKNKHKAALGILDMVEAGQYEMGHSASYYWKGKDINTMPFTTMPFGMTTAEQDAWYYYGGGEALAKEVFDKHGVIQHQGGSTGNQMGGWFSKEINSVDDLKGLKMRIPGFAGEVMHLSGLAQVWISTWAFIRLHLITIRVGMSLQRTCSS